MNRQQTGYTQEQPTRHMQEPNGHTNMAKLALLVMAFGVISYIWLKTSRELVKEIDKGWDDNW
jgi:hypothetical protein